MIFDIAGVDDPRQLRSALKPKGTLCSGGKGGKWLGPMRRSGGATPAATFKSQKAKILAASRTRADLEFLTELFDAGSVTNDRQHLPTRRRCRGLREIRGGTVRGKIAVEI